MLNKIYEIKLSSISIGGNYCKNFEVVFEEPYCSSIKCEYNAATKVIVISVPPDCADSCIYANIKCLDTSDCTFCPDTERIKICPCTVDGDCQDCETCVNGLCVTQCEEGEFCKNDVCVECDDDNPCPDGKVCNDGVCECPPSKPFVNGAGECVECIEGTVEGCDICKNGVWVNKECKEGVCNPDTEDCVDCLKSGDCTKANECCVEKDCECCPGYERNLVTGECDLKPECEEDSDCPECEICTDEGCVPLVCPEGFICVDGDCVSPCDGVICPEGFDCVDGDCVENPCIPLTDPVEGCPDGYGLSGNECCPCDTFDCTTCQDIVGCDCINGSDCEATIDPEDCTDDLSTNKVDESCDQEFTLDLKNKCNCGALTLDSFMDEGSLSNDVYTIGIGSNIRKGFGNINTYEGLSIVSDNTKPDIASNEEADSGIIELRVTPFYNIYVRDLNGNLIFIEEVAGSETTQIANIGGVGTVNFTQSFQKIGTEITELKIVSKYTVKLVQKSNFEFPNSCNYTEKKTLASWTIGSNSIFNEVVTGDELVQVATLASNDERDPLFVYRKTDGSNYTENPFRKVYIPQQSNGKYVDTLYGPDSFNEASPYPLSEPEGRLLSNHSYLLEVDCGCDRSLDTGKLTFCNPDELNYDISDCGKTLTINPPFLPCEVNQDLRQFGLTLDHPGQVFYDMYINGAKVETFRHDQVNGMIKADETSGMFGEYSYGEVIRSIEIVNSHSNTACISYNLPDPLDITPDISFRCPTTSGNGDYDLIVNTSLPGGLSITSVTRSGANVSYTSNGLKSITVPSLANNTNYQVQYFISNGCVVEDVVNYRCCTVEAEVQISGDCTVDNTITVTPSGGSGPYNIVAAVEGQEIESFTNVAVSETFSTALLGELVVTVTDSLDCDTVVTNNLTEGSEIVVVTPDDTVICDGSPYTYEATFSQEAVGATLVYSVNGVQNTQELASTSFTISLTSNTDISLVRLEFTGGCELNLNRDFSLEYVTTLSASFTPLGSVCSGSTYNLEAVVSPIVSNVTVTLTNGSSSATNANGIATFEYVANNNTTYEIESLTTASGCEFTENDSISVTVVPGLSVISTVVDCSVDNTTYRREYTMNSNTFTIVSQSAGISTNNTGAGVLQVDADSGMGYTIELEDGGCTFLIEEDPYSCECPEIVPPIVGNTTFCPDGNTGAVSTNNVTSVNVGTGLRIKLYNDQGSTLSTSTGSTESFDWDAIGEGSLFTVTAFDPISTCESVPVTINVNIVQPVVPTISLHTYCPDIPQTLITRVGGEILGVNINTQIQFGTTNTTYLMGPNNHVFNVIPGLPEGTYNVVHVIEDTRGGVNCLYAVAGPSFDIDSSGFDCPQDTCTDLSVTSIFPVANISQPSGNTNVTFTTANGLDYSATFEFIGQDYADVAKTALENFRNNNDIILLPTSDLTGTDTYIVMNTGTISFITATSPNVLTLRFIDEPYEASCCEDEFDADYNDMPQVVSGETPAAVGGVVNNVLPSAATMDYFNGFPFPSRILVKNNSICS